MIASLISSLERRIDNIKNSLENHAQHERLSMILCELRMFKESLYIDDYDMILSEYESLKQILNKTVRTL